jgi:hypothetical protein
LGKTEAFVNLGLCYERGEGVSTDLVEAARFYKIASDRGNTDAMMSLGLFHWCGLGGFNQDQDEARRYWQLAGFDLNAPFLRASGSNDPNDLSLVSADGSGIIESNYTQSNADCSISDDVLRVSESNLPEPDSDRSGSEDESRSDQSELERESEEDSSVSERRTERFESAKVETDFEFAPSFEFWNADRVRSIESVVLFDGHQSVREMLLSLPRPSVSELSKLIAEGIVREGNRCLHSSRDSSNGTVMFNEMMTCSDLRSIFRLCVNFYTRATFLYRRVNQFMRDTFKRDEETGRNIGIYIGILRECFCVRSSLNPLEWRIPAQLYRGAKFGVGVIVDYARRQNEDIWWQGFTSARSAIEQARRFEGNVMFEISVVDPAPSISEYSSFPDEQEFVLNPYQRFAVGGVRWNESMGRWVIQIVGSPSTNPDSWFVESPNADGLSVPPTEDNDK